MKPTKTTLAARAPKRTPRSRTARVADGHLHAPPIGLLPMERQWLEWRASQVGGMTAALRHLVRLNIVFEAALATADAMARLAQRLERQGLPVSAIHRRAEALGEHRASWRLRNLFLNLMGWQRPGAADGYGDAPDDDPAHIWSRATVRRLIAEGRPRFAAGVRERRRG